MVNPKGGAPIFWPIFLENYMKTKKIGNPGVGGEGVFLSPPSSDPPLGTNQERPPRNPPLAFNKM